MKLPQPQVIEENGRPAYAVLRWSDWERMADALEDQALGAVADEARRDLEAGREVLLPADVALRIADGACAVAVLREWLGLSLDELATRARIAPADLAGIEAGDKPATAAEADQLASVLGVPARLLRDV